MLPISNNGYSEASVLAALKGWDGKYDLRFRFELYDRSRNLLGETTNIVGGFVRATRKARIRRGAQFIIRKENIDLDAYAAAVLAFSPIVYLRLGDTSGTTAADASGNSHPGTYVNSPTLNQGSLLAGDTTNGAVKLNGTTQYVTIANSSAFNVTTFTIGAWIKIGPTGAIQEIASRDDTTSNKQFQFRVTASGYLELVLWMSPTPTAAVFTTRAKVTDNKTYFVAATYDGAYVIIYLNGEPILKTAETRTLNSVTRLMEIGSVAESGGFLNGTVDEFAFYGSAHPSQVIRHRYQSGSNNLYEIHYLTDRIIPYLQMIMSDGGFVEWPLGEFVIPAPTRNDDETTERYSVQAYDKLKLFDDYKVDSRYVINSGTAYTTAIGNALALILSASEYSIAASAATLPFVRSWEIGTSLLDIVNDLLKGLQYAPLRFNGFGVANLVPIVEPANKTVSATWEVGEDSYLGFEMEQTSNLNETFNKVIARRQTPKGALLTATATNEDGSHPTSVPNIGVKPTVIDNNDAADQSTLNTFARNELLRVMEPTENQKRKALFQAFLEEEDIVEIDDDEVSLSGKFIIDELQIDLSGRPPFFQDFVLTRVPELSA